MNLKELLAEVEELDRTASKGPWTTDHDDTAVDSSDPDPHGDWIVEPKDGEVNESHHPNNMQFIARARILLPDLARRLKLTVEMVSECIGVFDSFGYGINTIENLKKKLLIQRDLLRDRLREIKEPL